jgi:FAD/FMN-containing dehydrogenase
VTQLRVTRTWPVSGPLDPRDEFTRDSNLLLCIRFYHLGSWVVTMMDTNTVTQRQCLLNAGLQHLVLLPQSNAYIAREASYWAANVALHPECIVQPSTPEEVSRVVKALANADGLLALRSGGHTQWAGSNDVERGITIDLGRMTDVTYDAQSNLASLQPGSRWGDVYEKLLNYSVCVTGGRDGNVGIGGFLTGGGNSYYAGLYGLACDTVANFEVVLSNGDIVDANAKSRPDLWAALKGGSGNFGIVTRFDMYAFPAHDLWGGIRVATRSEGDKLAQTMVNFTDNNEKNPEDAYIINYTFGPSAPNVLVAHVVVDTNGIIDSSAFREIQKVPVVMDDVKMRTMANMANSYLVPSNQQYVR